ncbi:hypothetical protein Csa_011497 [Cucumis sativus]|uniref:Uncharacterized protein n=1 Tax=Cucumis sativus TaxID=3659 RepID=A0A0A0L6F5_CUCSA|nr:hypothetical protein Csa_011497 [Cucumis sativus]
MTYTTMSTLSYCRQVDLTSTELFCRHSDLTSTLVYCRRVDLVGESCVSQNPILTSSRTNVSITSYNTSIMTSMLMCPSTSV